MNGASLIVFLAGMAAGWLLNDVLDRLTHAQEALMEPQHPRRRSARSAITARAAAARRRLGGNHAALVGLIAVAFAFVALVVGALNSTATRDQNALLAAAAQHNAAVSACQARFNEGVTRALAARARLNDKRTAILVGFIGDLFRQRPLTNPTPAQLAARLKLDRELFARYKAGTARLSEQLAARQVPVLGGQCGTPTAIPSPARS